MRVLFVARSVESTEPLSIMLLSALAKEKIPDCKTFFYLLSDGRLADKIKEVKPDVIAFSATTGLHKYYLAAAKEAKSCDKNIFTVMGGPHCTFFPEIILRGDFDAIGVGECDEAWPELLSALENNKDINAIPNIITKDNFGKSVRAIKAGEHTRHMPVNIRARKTFLDDLPFMDYDLINEIPEYGRRTKRTFMASRGCPFKCTYCFNRFFNEIYQGKGKIFNRFSVERICDELVLLSEKYETQSIKFYDDVFVLKSDAWLEEFAEKYPKKVGIPFHCLTRADIVAKDPKILQLLKKAGLQSISMSIESGNDFVREKILERKMSRDEILEAFKQSHNLGIPTFSNVILGIPVKKEIEEENNLFDSIRRDIQSLDINIQCETPYCEFMILFPYPGTKLGYYCLEHGFFKGDYDNFPLTYQSRSPLDCFTEKEKLIQTNLSLLGTVCVMLSGSDSRFVKKIIAPLARNLTVNLLIKMPLTKFYLFLYVLAKAYLVKRKMYNVKLSFVNEIKNLREMLILEYHRHFS